MKNLVARWRAALDGPDSDYSTAISLEHAAAVLLVEVMAADDEFDDVESETIRQSLIRHFHLSTEEADQLLAESEQSHHETHDLYEFTNVVNGEFQAPQKFELLKSMWKVAYADGVIDRYEEHMIRKLAELLHLSHSDFIRARLEAEACITPDTKQ